MENEGRLRVDYLSEQVTSILEEIWDPAIQSEESKGRAGATHLLCVPGAVIKASETYSQASSRANR